MLFRSLPRNEKGRDVVVGDLHGEYDEVVAGLKEMGFDYDRDRLFSVGDLIDRGKESARCIKFLSRPWITAVRGNHEDMFLKIYEKGEPHPDVLEFWVSKNGMGWWRDTDAETRAQCLEAWAKMPVAVEIATDRGMVGIVHAEVPVGMGWAKFTKGIQSGDEKLIEKAVWGRTRIEQNDESGVEGIDRLFVGHTPVSGPKRLGNVYYIDTGLVFGKKQSDPKKGRLSMQGIADATMVLTAEQFAETYLDMRVEDEPPSTPFGRYGG
jgi:serine/threonine protein phosphatase 1